tara:strand:- start:1172 stop:1330 length:159 start_codon:yes stop_codon:yes gene_type:complete
MIKFILGFVLGFAAHYAIFCSKDIKQKCVQCWEFAKLKSKIVKANKKRKGKK